MPQVRISPNSNLSEIKEFANILKCSHIGNGVMQLNDLARLDLYTPIGITRQINLINGIFPLWENSYLENLEPDSSKYCISIIWDTSSIFSEEFYEIVRHYYHNQIFIARDWDLFFHFKSAKIGADFLRVILSDLTDTKLIKEVRVFVATDILTAVIARKKTIFLRQSYVKSFFLGKIPSDQEILDILKCFGYWIISSEPEGWEFSIPFHRLDIFEEQDLIEDILLFQMEKFTRGGNPPPPIDHRQLGWSNEKKGRRMNSLRDDLISFGFREIKTPLLRKEGKNYTVRSSIVPSLLEYEKGIQYLSNPHQIFEIGSVREGERLVDRLILSRIDSETDFNTFFSIIYHILNPLSAIPLTLKPFDSNRFSPGKGFILMRNTVSIGELWVVDQKVQAQYRIKHAILLAEIDLAIIDIHSYES